MIQFIVLANNSLVTKNIGMSGGDRIFIEIIKRYSRDSDFSITLFSGINVKELLDSKDIKNVQYILLSRKNISVFNNLFINHIKRLFLGVINACKYEMDKDARTVIYSASDFWPDVIPALILKLKNRNAKWIGTLYQFVEFPLKVDSPYRNRKFLIGILYWLEQFPIYYLIRLFSDFVFVTSNPDINRFLKHKALNKIFVVRGGVDEIPNNIEVGKVNSNKLFDAVFIGRLHVQKGILELLDIWKTVCRSKPNAQLAIIGNGPLENQIKIKIRKLKLTDNVRLLGFMDGSKKYKIFKESKIVVHPAVYDSGGMAAAEAMAWGLPGVSFDLESLKSYYPKGILKADKFNIKSVADMILLLLNNPKVYKKKSEEAINLIRKEWSWDKRADEIKMWIKERL